MSTQSVKNICKSQIESVIKRAKNRIEEEGKKKIDDLKNQISDPQSIAEKLNIDVSEDSCSAEGKAKFEKIMNQILSPINKAENLIGNVLETISNIEEKLDPIINMEGPIGRIQKLEGDLEPLKKTLNIIIMAAPALLGALTGLLSNAAAADGIVTQREKAIAKIAEFTALLSSIPALITFYLLKARKVKEPIDKLKSKATFLLEEIIRIKAFIQGLFNQMMAECDAFDNQTDTNVTNPDLNQELTDYLALLDEQYQEVLQQLQLSGNTQAWERVFAINSDLSRAYNKSLVLINPQNVGDELDVENND